ncbi:hypothetical protein [Arsenophonus endosymbiont of Aleurodicus floccissimus]|uniref:hypothetical protein n=1 Tax=Arsenophonus endosymbiont of Aleurodicus floccissimus TaxID=2152761 RepID=UPI0016024C82|nr:hypothetical protein [Arsenophonus endosymbiont of Aleurodicus floccissimus]
MRRAHGLLTAKIITKAISYRGCDLFGDNHFKCVDLLSTTDAEQGVDFSAY